MKKANRKTQNLNAQLLYSHRRIIAVWALAAVLLGFFVVLAFPATSEAAVIRRAPNNLGLVGYWSFDDARGSTATDFSGNGNAGTLTNMDTSSDWVAGKRGGALEFDGSDDHVRTDYNGLGEAGQSFTVSIWIKSSDTLSGNNFAINNYVDSDHTGFFAIGSDNNAKGMFLWLRDDNNTEVAKTNYYEPAFDGEWHHYTGVRDIENDEVRFYIDGELKETVNSSNTNPVRDNDSFLGFMRHNDKNSQTLEGKIDEVRVYDRVLSSSEVKGLYNAGGYAKRNATDSTLFPDKLIGHWPMDGPDISGSTVKDVKGANDGTKNGDPIARRGRLGQALDFDGNDDLIEIPDRATPASVTVSAWVKWDGDSQKANIASGGFKSTPDTTEWELRVYSDGSVDWSTWDGDAGHGFRPSSYTLPKDTWTHVTGIYDAADEEYRLYIDGSRKDAQVDSYGPADADNDAPWSIGAVYDNRSGFLQHIDGKIDDVRIYDTALSTDEISRLYTATKPDTINSSQNQKLTDGLVGMWSFDGQDLSGSTAEDVSGNGNDGILNSDPQPAIGRIGQALEFDGSDDGVEVASLNLSSTQKIALSFWVKWDNFADDDSILIESSSNFNNNKGGILINPNSSASGKWSFTIQQNGNYRQESIDRNGEGEWHHYAAIFDNSTASGDITIFRDGGEISTTINKDELSSTNDFKNYNWYFMGRNLSSLFAEGGLDNVRIYDRALSESEIERLYSLGR